MDQYVENFGILSEKAFNQIQTLNVMIVGLGGLGGHLANTLTRLGVNHLFLVDFDTFSISNLNRQLFSNHYNIGLSKVLSIKDELLKIQPNIEVKTYIKRIEDIQISELKHIDIIFDAVDHILTKLYLEKLASDLSIPFIHGAIAGYFGQIGFMMPGSHILSDLYQNQTKGIEKELRSPSFTPAIIANMMVSEFVKWISNKDTTLVNQLMMIDLLNHHYEIMIKKE
jgi:molybdopterin-synthase adenylyltransferase